MINTNIPNEPMYQSFKRLLQCFPLEWRTHKIDECIFLLEGWDIWS